LRRSFANPLKFASRRVRRRARHRPIRDYRTGVSRTDIAPAVCWFDARWATTRTLGLRWRKSSLSWVASRCRASTHSATFAWFDATDWRPQYRQTVCFVGGADFVTVSSMRSGLATHGRQPQTSPMSITA